MFAVTFFPGRGLLASETTTVNVKLIGSLMRGVRGYNGSKKRAIEVTISIN